MQTFALNKIICIFIIQSTAHKLLLPALIRPNIYHNKFTSYLQVFISNEDTLRKLLKIRNTSFT